MGRKSLSSEQGMLIDFCGSVHTIGMQFPIDLFFVNRSFQVVRIVRNVSPGKFMVTGGLHAARVYETATDAWPQKIQVGDLLLFQETKGKKMDKIAICGLSFLSLLFSALSGYAKHPNPWSMKDLSKTPHVFSTERTNDIQKFFFEGLPFKGKLTRVFAYYGVPSHPKGTRIPGNVLIHGGGGSAFYRWVKLWNDRDYAAISMDTCGCISKNDDGQKRFWRAIPAVLDSADSKVAVQLPTQTTVYYINLECKNGFIISTPQQELNE